MRTSLFHGLSNPVKKEDLLLSLPSGLWPHPSPFKSKGKWPCCDKSQDGLGQHWVILGKHHSDDQESAGGGHCTAVEGDSHVSKQKLAKTSFKEKKYLLQNPGHGALWPMEAGGVKRAQKLRNTQSKGHFILFPTFLWRFKSQTLESEKPPFSSRLSHLCSCVTLDKLSAALWALVSSTAKCRIKKQYLEFSSGQLPCSVN